MIVYLVPCNKLLSLRDSWQVSFDLTKIFFCKVVGAAVEGEEAEEPNPKYMSFDCETLNEDILGFFHASDGDLYTNSINSSDLRHLNANDMSDIFNKFRNIARDILEMDGERFEKPFITVANVICVGSFFFSLRSMMRCQITNLFKKCTDILTWSDADINSLYFDEFKYKLNEKFESGVDLCNPDEENVPMILVDYIAMRKPLFLGKGEDFQRVCHQMSLSPTANFSTFAKQFSAKRASTKAPVEKFSSNDTFSGLNANNDDTISSLITRKMWCVPRSRVFNEFRAHGDVRDTLFWREFAALSLKMYILHLSEFSEGVDIDACLFCDTTSQNQCQSFIMSAQVKNQVHAVPAAQCQNFVQCVCGLGQERGEKNSVRYKNKLGQFARKNSIICSTCTTLTKPIKIVKVKNKACPVILNSTAFGGFGMTGPYKFSFRVPPSIFEDKPRIPAHLLNILENPSDTRLPLPDGKKVKLQNFIWCGEGFLKCQSREKVTVECSCTVKGSIFVCPKCGQIWSILDDLTSMSQGDLLGYSIPMLALFVGKNTFLLLKRDFRAPRYCENLRLLYRLWVSIFMVQKSSTARELRTFSNRTLKDVCLGGTPNYAIGERKIPRVFIDFAGMITKSFFFSCDVCIRACTLSVRESIANHIAIPHSHLNFQSNCTLCREIYYLYLSSGVRIKNPIGKKIPSVGSHTSVTKVANLHNHYVTIYPFRDGSLFSYEDRIDCNQFTCGVDVFRDQRSLKRTVLFKKADKSVLKRRVVEVEACILDDLHLGIWIGSCQEVLPSCYSRYHQMLFRDGMSADEIYRTNDHGEGVKRMRFSNELHFFESLVRSVDAVKTDLKKRHLLDSRPVTVFGPDLPGVIPTQLCRLCSMGWVDPIFVLRSKIKYVGTVEYVRSEESIERTVRCEVDSFSKSICTVASSKRKKTHFSVSFGMRLATIIYKFVGDISFVTILKYFGKTHHKQSKSDLCILEPMLKWYICPISPEAHDRFFFFVCKAYHDFCSKQKSFPLTKPRYTFSMSMNKTLSAQLNSQTDPFINVRVDRRSVIYYYNYWILTDAVTESTWDLLRPNCQIVDRFGQSVCTTGFCFKRISTHTRYWVWMEPMSKKTEETVVEGDVRLHFSSDVKQQIEHLETYYEHIVSLRARRQRLKMTEEEIVDKINQFKRILHESSTWRQKLKNGSPVPNAPPCRQTFLNALDQFVQMYSKHDGFFHMRSKAIKSKKIDDI